MINEGVQFRLKVRGWFNLWKNKNYNSKQKNDTKWGCADDRNIYIVQNPADGFVEALKMDDVDFFFQILESCYCAFSPIRTSEAERVVSEIRTLNVVYEKWRWKPFEFISCT